MFVNQPLKLDLTNTQGIAGTFLTIKETKIVHRNSDITPCEIYPKSLGFLDCALNFLR